VTSFVELLMVLIALANLMLVGSSRISACINLAAAQGIALSLLPLLVTTDGIGLRTILLATVVFVVKGLFLPRLLRRALLTADVKHQVEPWVGFTASIMLNILLLVLSFWVTARFTIPRPMPSPLALPLALSTILTGLFIIISRFNALNQVVGYLVLENGVYLFGLILAPEVPLLIEMGILLDVFVAVFVMGITIFHISREFDHIDVDQLTTLKD
jgi:hydrogenase-4 component E